MKCFLPLPWPRGAGYRSDDDTFKGAPIAVPLPSTERRQVMSASYNVTGRGLLDNASVEAQEKSH